MIAADNYLAALSDDEPCGPNLEYDKDFIELERISAGRPEQQVGNTVIEAEGPDWRTIEKLASSLLERSRDLRIGAHLTRALLHTSGLAGFAEGLALLHGLFEQQWASVHPQLDPDDDNDPTLRMNTIAALADGATVLAWLRATPLVSAPRVGKFSLRDIMMASGELAIPEGMAEPPKASTIEGAFNSVEPSVVETTLQYVQSAEQHAQALENLAADYVGTGALTLEPLRTMLKKIARQLTQRIEARGGSSESAPAEAEATGEDGGEASYGSTPRASGGGAGNALSGSVNSREDVNLALDKIIDYYERNEPASPIPILLKRCKRFVTMNFMELLADIAPEALPQVEGLRGRTADG